MAVGGCQKARLLSDYLIVLPLSCNFGVHVHEERCAALPLIITEQKIVAADTDKENLYDFGMVVHADWNNRRRELKRTLAAFLYSCQAAIGL